MINPEYVEMFNALIAPFDEGEVKWKNEKGGKKVPYVTARTVMNRLDNVLGPERWWDAYVPGEHSVLCRLSILLPDGRVLTKEDAGGFAGMADEGDDDKSGYSDAFKRAAVKFGVSRYLYGDGVPCYIAHPADVSFWTHMFDVIATADVKYRAETGYSGPPVLDHRKALKSIIRVTYDNGIHTYDPEQKRTGSQWAELVNEIAGRSPGDREWLDECLRAYIKVELEKAGAQHAGVP